MMELNPKEVELFKSFKDSAHGVAFLDYLNRLLNYLSDIRNIPEGQTGARLDTVKAIEENIIKRITNVNEEKKTNNNQYQ